MEAVAVGQVASCGENSGVARQQAPVPFVVIVRKGPSWSLADLEPLCRLLSKRFDGEIWAFGSYDADVYVDRFRVRVVNDERSASRLGRLALTTRQMLRWAAELRAARVRDLVFVSLEPFNSGLLGLYVARRARGIFVCEVNGVYANRNNFASGRVPIRLRFEARRALGAFVLSRATAVRLLFAEQLRGFIRLPARVLTRQFFDIAQIDRFYPGAEEKMILGVGYPFRVKGFDILCRAFRVIAAEHPDWKLVLIGHLVPEELRAAGLGHPQIEAHPGVKQPELAEWMSRCAIFALPSRTEAMAVGLPAICPAVGSIPSMIAGRGWLTDSSDSASLENAMDYVLRNPANVVEAARGCSAYVRENFDSRHSVARYCHLLLDRDSPQ